VRARQMVVELEQPGIGAVKQAGFPIKLSRTPASVRRPAPALGEQDAEVLAEAPAGTTEESSGGA